MHTFLNQLLLGLSVFLFSTLPTCYGHIEDVHKEYNAEKITFDKFTAFFNLAIFRPVLIYNNG